MKKYLLSISIICLFFLTTSETGCDGRPENTSAKDEQAHTELNQQALNNLQPAPNVKWSLERDNLIKRFLLMNDRGVVFYMYVFIEGDRVPVGFYQVNKVSSVNSQLTNTMQIVHPSDGGGWEVLPSPAEDGSYGTNGEGVFGFTPDDVYIEHNMKYIVSTIPLHFEHEVNSLAVVNVATKAQLKSTMEKLLLDNK
jgi:hypothetical protein